MKRFLATLLCAALLATVSFIPVSSAFTLTETIVNTGTGQSITVGAPQNSSTNAGSSANASATSSSNTDVNVNVNVDVNVEAATDADAADTNTDTDQPEPTTIRVHKADLYIKSITLDNDDKEDVLLTVGNKGEADVPADQDIKAEVRVDGELSYIVTLHNNSNKTMLGAGQQSTFNLGVLINTAGPYDVEILVDSDNAIDESNENNNSKKVTLTRRPLADHADHVDHNHNNSSCKNAFDDIHGHWAEEAICELWEMDVVDGNRRDEFNPNDEITRAEFLKMALLAADYNVHEINSGDIFTDVDEHDWYYEYVTYAAFKGYVHGYEDGTFRPNEEITRAEAIVLIMRIADEELWNYDNRDIDFDDVDEDDWFAYAVILADRKDIIRGANNRHDEFNPYDDLTRAEAAVMIYRAWEAFYE